MTLLQKLFHRRHKLVLQVPKLQVFPGMEVALYVCTICSLGVWYYANWSEKWEQVPQYRTCKTCKNSYEVQSGVITADGDKCMGCEWWDYSKTLGE